MLMYQSHFVHCLGKMLRVCVLGHSLVPMFIPLNSSTVQLEILCYPGATITSLTDKLTDLDFWTRRYDGIILCIGGNDLARLTVDEVFNRLCDLCRRLRTQTTFLTVCTVEYRLYPRHNRFGVNQETHSHKAMSINRKIKRFTRGIDAKIVDLGRRCFTLQRVRDGVHFTIGGQNDLCQRLNSVIRAFVLRSSS